MPKHVLMLNEFNLIRGISERDTHGLVKSTSSRACIQLETCLCSLPPTDKSDNMYQLNPSCFHACVDYGYEVEYTRVPVTDEKAPKEKDFALLMRRLWKPPEGAALIFNCQMGRGRTSTGMIIASLLHLRRRVKTVDLPTEPQGTMLNWHMTNVDYGADS